MKILHLPTAVGGNAYGLSRGERALGHISDVLVAQGNFLDYPADYTLFHQPPANRIQSCLRRMRLLKTFLSMRNAYDVFHFNFGQSLLHCERLGLPLFELPFYPQKAKLVFTYNGCDARQKFPAMRRNPYAPCHDPECYGGVCNSGRQDAYRRKAIARMDAYAHAIFALNPDLLHFLPKRARFLPYAIAGWDTIETRLWTKHTKRIRIAHAPTNRAAKGTPAIVAAMETLCRDYKNTVEFLLVEGVSNKKALEMYASADIVIDQLRIGWYGALSVEVMKLGRPVACYIRNEDLHFIPKDMAEQLRQAFIAVTEDSLLDTLRTIVENPRILEVAARAAIDYVHAWHAPRVVARLASESYCNLPNNQGT